MVSGGVSRAHFRPASQALTDPSVKCSEEDALFSLNFSYGAVGHNFVTGIETTGLDLATALVHRYGQDQIKVLEGIEILRKEEKEIATIQKDGQT